MARVNYKTLFEYLQQSRTKITDEEFFTSRLLAGHFEELAAVQTRRYNYSRRVRVYLYWDTYDQRIAWTDNDIISINTGHSLIVGVDGRMNRYRLIGGLFSHELGHILYSDFLMMQSFANAFLSMRWYPKKPGYRNAKERDAAMEIWEYAKDDELNLKALLMVAKDLQNILEDGYIEMRMLNDYPGRLGQYLAVMRKRQFDESPTVTQMKEREATHDLPIFASVRNIMLTYAKFGEIKYGDEPLTDDRIQTVFKLLSVIDDNMYSADSHDRYTAVNLILIRCWDYVKEYCEKCKEQLKQQEENGESAAIEEIIKKIIKQGGVSSSEIGQGKSRGLAGSGQAVDSSKNAAKRAETHKLAGDDKEESDNGQNDEAGALAQDETDNAEEPAENGDGGDDGGSMIGQSLGGERQEVTSEEKGRIPNHYTDRVAQPENGGLYTDPDYDENPYDHAADDIERILEGLAKEQALEKLEDDRLKELNEIARNISYGDIHKGVPITVNRQSCVYETHIEQYNQVAHTLIAISKQLQRGILQRLQESRRSEKISGLISGRRLAGHSLYRQDGKMFYKNKLPNETELAVGLVIDESGSMGGAQRCTYARATAIILEDFCRNLGIPVMIYGHSTNWRTYGASVELYSYVEFDAYDNNDKYRLMNISSRGGNRDGAALRYVAERLMERPEPQKLLMIISDGQPADEGYSGTAAEEDLSSIKQEYQRKGVLFVAAAIGSDKANIERIYGDSFLDITDLTQLPVRLTNIVKKYIRV